MTFTENILTQQTIISIADISRRIYNHFLETISSHEQLQVSEKSFIIYTHTFKAILNDLELKENEQYYNLSFYDRLFKNYLPNSTLADTFEAENVQELPEYSCENVINDLFFDILINAFHKRSDPDVNRIFNELQFTALRECLVLQFVQFIYLEKDHPETLEDLVKHINEEPASLLKFIKSPTANVQKIFIAYSLNNGIVNKPILAKNAIPTLYNTLADNMVEDTYKNIDRLFDHIKPSLTLKQVLTESISELIALPSTNLIQSTLMNILKSKFSAQLNTPVVDKMAFRIVSLPENILDFGTKYYKHPCHKCSCYNENLYICLICETISCQSHCQKDEGKLGNLNAHATKFHMGSGLFLGVHSQNIIFTYGLYNALCSGKSLYVDNLGQTLERIKQKYRKRVISLDFKKFILNEDTNNYIRNLIRNNSIGIEIFNILKIEEDEDEEYPEFGVY